MNRYVMVGFLTMLATWLPADQPPSKSNDPDQSEKAAIDPNDRPMSYWMEKKLEYSQQALISLVTGDLEDVQLNATRLNLLNRVERFVRRKNPNYQKQLKSFDLVSADLATQANNKNIEGATLAFNQLTVSCVKCHQTLRADKGNSTAKGDEPKGDAPQ